MLKPRRVVRALSAVAWVGAASVATAVAVPPGFNVQGRLTDSTGVNRNGQYSIQFSLFDQPTSGNLLWTKTYQGVNVVNGNFQVVLQDPPDLATQGALAAQFSGDSRFLEIRVLGGPGIAAPEQPMVPRQQLVSVPYAIKAAVADSVIASPLPPGTILPFAGASPPPGFLECDGSAQSAAQYPALYQAIGTAWGYPLYKYFNLPDLRGAFLRGWNHGKTGPWSDPDAASMRMAQYQLGATGDNVGSYQTDEIKDHTHGEPRNLTAPQVGVGTMPGGTDTLGISSENGGSGHAETRPKNADVMFIIKF